MLKHVAEKWIQDRVGMFVKICVLWSILSHLDGWIQQRISFEIPLIVEEAEKINLITSLTNPTIFDDRPLYRIRYEDSV